MSLTKIIVFWVENSNYLFIFVISLGIGDPISNANKKCWECLNATVSPLAGNMLIDDVWKAVHYKVCVAVNMDHLIIME